MVKMNTIAGLVVLCMVSAVAAFFLPNAVGTMLSFVSIGAAAAIGVLAIVAFVRLLTQRVLIQALPPVIRPPLYSRRSGNAQAFPDPFTWLQNAAPPVILTVNPIQKEKYV